MRSQQMDDDELEDREADGGSPTTLRIVRTNMPPVVTMPPPQPRLPLPLHQLQAKEDMRAWRNPANSPRWYLSGRRPVEASVSIAVMKTILRDVAQVTPDVHCMLSDMTNFDIRKFAAPGDDLTSLDISLPDRMDILTSSVIKYLSRGIAASDADSGGRIAALEVEFRRGWRILRQHATECRSLLRVPANYSLLATLINLDLNHWAGTLSEQATLFVGEHVVPPPVQDFPSVIAPTWDRLTAYVGAGGLHNSQHTVRTRSLPPQSRGRSGARTPSGKPGYCFQWASAAGCPKSARECKWEHAHNPARGASHRPGGAGRGRRGDRGSQGDGQHLRNRSGGGDGGSRRIHGHDGASHQGEGINSAGSVGRN